jgi:hypothetical protein
MSVSSPTPNLGHNLIKLLIVDMQLLALNIRFNDLAVDRISFSYSVITMKITNAAQKLNFAVNVVSISVT